MHPDARPPSPDAAPPDGPPPGADPHDHDALDASISMERANVLALGLMPAIFLSTLLPFAAFWGWRALGQGIADLATWRFLPALLAAVVVHEGLHALGFLVAGRAPPSAIRFGIHRETLSPFAGCRVPVSAAAYRVAVALPALLLGVLPLAWGLARGVGWAAVWGSFMLVTAGGDLLVLWAVRSVAGGTRVIDHPGRVGCRVLPDRPAPPPAPS